MKKKYIPLFFLVTVGCVDLDLLDDMVLMDGGAPSSSGNKNASIDSDGEGDNDLDNTGDSMSQIPTPDISDTAPPQIIPLTSSADERIDQNVCIAEGPASASMRFATDEPATLSLVMPDGGILKTYSTPWDTTHLASLGGLLGEVDTSAALKVEDINGNAVTLELLLQGKGGPTVALTEILADPIGPEPAQEFVEIINYGAVDVDLTDWMIDDNGDANGGTIAPGTLLTPGEVGMLVSQAYDPADVAGPAPPANARIIVMDTAIGSNGLKNSESETLELYDATRTIISRYNGALGPPKEGVSVIRRAPELPDGSPWVYLMEPNNTATPGEVTPIASSHME